MDLNGPWQNNTLSSCLIKLIATINPNEPTTLVVEVINWIGLWMKWISTQPCMSMMKYGPILLDVNYVGQRTRK